MSSKSGDTTNGELGKVSQPAETFTNPSVHEQDGKTLPVSEINNTASQEEEKRRRIMSQKAVQNAMQAKTIDLNAREKEVKNCYRQSTKCSGDRHTFTNGRHIGFG